MRFLRLRGANLRILTLRPDTKAAFATNYFHETWHILSDKVGAQLLARLMWGLSFQRERNTVILIHGPHLATTPFGAERSDPILLLRSEDLRLNPKVLKGLKQHLKRLGQPDRTVRLHTFGLDQALASDATMPVGDWSREWKGDDWLHYNQTKSLWAAERMERRGGFVCYQAPGKLLRQSARVVARMSPGKFGDYVYLAENNSARWPCGEVQIFKDFHQRCSAAKVARKKVLSADSPPCDPESLYELIAKERDRILYAGNRSA